ncbi:MAG: hypothetical protein IT433_07945, partial [Phycisphaerales bacterium]|nr:hypothetical protein [Phycisphaerales bacterium]
MVDAAGGEHTVGNFAYGEDVRIDLADISANHSNFSFVRVIDLAEPPGDLSRVSLYRGEDTAIPDEVRVLLGSLVSSGAFPTNNVFPIPIPACRHWGLPLTPGGSDDAFVVENTVPEGTKVILAAAISGDLTGKV